MQEASVAHNCASSPVAAANVSNVDAQEQLATLVNRIAATTVVHWWKLLGDEPNSLCRLLDVSATEMRLILRKCKVLYGPKDSFRTTEFENLMRAIGCDCSMHRPTGKIECFLQLGNVRNEEYAVTVPKEMYSIGEGVLEKWPISGIHMPGRCTKGSRRLASALIQMSSMLSETGAGLEETEKNTNNESNSGNMTIYVNDLIGAIENVIMDAASQGRSYKFSQRTQRVLRKAAIKAIKGSIQAFLDAWVEEIGDEFDGKEAGLCLTSSTSPSDESKAKVVTGITTRAGTRETPSNNNNVQTFVTPHLDLTDDNEEEEDVNKLDIALSQIKEETLLQNLLHKRLLNKNQRVFMLEHKNGRKLRVIIPPDAQTSKAFVDEVRRTRWIKEMLHSKAHSEGMLLYLAQTEAADYVRVAEKKKLRLNTKVLNTPQTLALGRLTGVNDTQMTKLRSFLRHVGKADLKLSRSEVERIDRDVGLAKLPAAIHNTYTLEWSTINSNAKNLEKKPPEVCSFWNSDLIIEVAAEIDLVHHQMFLEKPDLLTIPSLDYAAPGFDMPGIVVLFGGDHGAGACPCSMKLNFSSPQERKERGELNYRCPTIQIASIDCTKDSFELLSNTVMPQIKRQLLQLRNSSAFVVYNQKNQRLDRKAFLFPKTLRATSFQTNNNLLFYHVAGHQRTIDLTEHFDMERVDCRDLRARTIISNFHDLYVGDLAFLAMAIGMNNSSGAHCIQCKKKAREFNCDDIQPQDIRTKASLTECLNEYNQRRLTSRSVRNHLGVNTVGLLDIDPQQIIVPILHCPMGLVDKILETFKSWTIYNVEALPEESETIRAAYKAAIVAAAQAIEFEEEARNLSVQAGNTAISMALYHTATTAKGLARKEEAKAKVSYDEMVKRHNSRIASLHQDFDVVFRSHNIKKEHYHGGKYNGVNCIRIMEKATVLFTDFCTAIMAKKVPDAEVSNDEVNLKCQQFARLMGLLDVIWSNVRGIDAGLLPTEAQTQQLRRALAEAKQMWTTTMNIKTLQPKWHLTFDGHLLQQVIKYGGLADKSDDTIEFQHQILMKLRDRYRSITSYQKRETCIRRELRRRKSPEIQAHIDQYEASIKRNPDGKRQLAAAERKQESRVAKRIKREAIVDG